MVRSGVPRLHLLVSFAYLGRDAGLAAYVDVLRRQLPVLIDSGAFTDWQMGRKAAAAGKPFEPITVEAYMRYLGPRASELWGYITLDKVRDEAQTAKNLRVLREAGFNPMPVLVVGARAAAVRELVAHNPAVCIAGSVDGSMRWTAQRLWRVQRETNGQCQPHGLGAVKMPDMLRLPCSTFDASSWNGGDRFGSLTRFSLQTASFTSAPSATLRRGGTGPMADHLRACNIGPTVLRDDQYWRRAGNVPSLVTAVAHLGAHARVALSGRRLFFACATVKQLQILAAAASVVRLPAVVGDYRRQRETLDALRAAHAKSPEHGAHAVAELLAAHTSDDGYPELRRNWSGYGLNPNDA